MGRLVGVLALLGLFACGDDDGMTEVDASMPIDAEPDAPEVDAFVPPPDPLPVDPSFEEDYVGEAASIVTTLRETYAPRYGWLRYVERNMPLVPLAEFGALHPQPGEPHQLRDQLAIDAVEWTAGELPEGARSVHFSFVVGDPQLVDQDSPALQPKNNSGGLPAFRPWGEMVPHLGDALLRSASAFHEQRPLDYVFVVGDVIENAQENELEWALALLEGGTISTDSGDRDDVSPGANNDAYDPFVAAGLPAGVPWINVIGNHDVLVNGNFPPGLIREVNATPAALEALTPLLSLVGLTLPGNGTDATHRGWFAPEARPIFNIEPATFELAQLPYRAQDYRALREATVPADPARDTLDICTYLERTATSPGTPSGHGISAEALANCRAIQDLDPTAPAGGWFVVDVGPALRVIALALGPVEGGAEGILARPFAGCEVAGEPCRDDPRYDQIAFLDAELARAADDGVAVLVMSHQSSGDIVVEPALASYRSFIEDDPLLLDIWNRWVPTPVDPIDAVGFRSRLAQSGVVIAHLAGHNHRHQVRAICANGEALDASAARCAAGTEGETGYWEITTTGIVDFPHQGRFLEIVHVGDGLGALYLTALDARMAPGSFTERARFVSRAFLAATTGDDGGLGDVLDRNVLLPFRIPASVEAAWSEAELDETLASETTLREPAGSAVVHPIWE